MQIALAGGEGQVREVDCGHGGGVDVGLFRHCGVCGLLWGCFLVVDCEYITSYIMTVFGFFYFVTFSCGMRAKEGIKKEENGATADIVRTGS